MAFQFKQFKVEDNLSSMKVGTDAVLLGSWIPAKDMLYTLEIGCGSGVISLMLAQKMKSFITAIDIDADSVKQAQSNFEHSKWNHQLQAVHTSLQDLQKRKTYKFDIVISNPPYFNNSLNSPYKNKTLSKHTNTLSYTELAKGIKYFLKKDGKAYLILPYTEAQDFIRIMKRYKLFLNQELLIAPKQDKAANRIIMEFSFLKSELSSGKLYLREENDQFSESYKSLCKEYYL